MLHFCFFDDIDLNSGLKTGMLIGIVDGEYIFHKKYQPGT